MTKCTLNSQVGRLPVGQHLPSESENSDAQVLMMHAPRTESVTKLPSVCEIESWARLCPPLEGSDPVVVNRVGSQDPMRMCVAEHSNLVEAFAPHRADEPCSSSTTVRKKSAICFISSRSERSLSIFSIGALQGRLSEVVVRILRRKSVKEDMTEPSHRHFPSHSPLSHEDSETREIHTCQTFRCSS